MAWEIRVGDCLEVLAGLESGSAQTCVTSPPYWGLRDYGVEPRVWDGDPDHEHEWGPERSFEKGGKGKGSSGLNNPAGNEVWEARDAAQTVRQGRSCACGAWLGALGLEPTPELFTEHLVEIFREVHRVLRDDGTLWLNLGDSYARQGSDSLVVGKNARIGHQIAGISKRNSSPPPGLKHKDLVGIPWRVAFALQADGWYLRSDVIWAKPNPMPESVTDRPTKSHEYFFLLSKQQRYFYDAEAIKEPGKDWSSGGPGVGIQSTEHYGAENGGNDGLAKLAARYKSGNKARKHGRDVGTPYAQPGDLGRSIPWESDGTGRNKRTVWTVTTRAFPGAHFATFPPKLIEPCVLAGSAKGDTVLDPFAGAGTTGLVSAALERDFIGVEINPEYAEMARDRIQRFEANPAGSLEGDPAPVDGQLGLLE